MDRRRKGVTSPRLNKEYEENGRCKVTGPAKSLGKEPPTWKGRLIDKRVLSACKSEEKEKGSSQQELAGRRRPILERWSAAPGLAEGGAVLPIGNTVESPGGLGWISNVSGVVIFRLKPKFWKSDL